MMRAHISIAMVRFRLRIKFDSDWNFADKPALLLRCVHAHTLICQFLFNTSITAANISSEKEKLELSLNFVPHIAIAVLELENTK